MKDFIALVISASGLWYIGYSCYKEPFILHGILTIVAIWVFVLAFSKLDVVQKWLEF